MKKALKNLWLNLLTLWMWELHILRILSYLIKKKILGRYFVVWRKYYVPILKERIINGGVMVSMFVFSLSVVDRGFMPQWSQTKDYKIGICCFFAKHLVLRSKSKDGLARNQNNVSEWGDMSIHGLLFLWATCSTIKIHLSILV